MKSSGTIGNDPQAPLKFELLYEYDESSPSCLIKRSTGKEIGHQKFSQDRHGDYRHYFWGVKVPWKRNKGGYRYFKVHRIVWYLCKGKWPHGNMGWLNNNSLDNRIENLYIKKDNWVVDNMT